MVLVTGRQDPARPTALLFHLAAEPARYQHHDCRRPVDSNWRREPGADEEQIGLNFAAALRAFLRQDPTSFWSAKSATLNRGNRHQGGTHGNLVLSTLHTNGAPETITRLMNMESSLLVRLRFI